MGKPTLQAFAQDSAIDTAKLLAGDAIQALNHKDLNGGLEHLRIIVQELGISGNSSLVSHLRTTIPAIISKQSTLYTGSAHVQANMTSSNANATARSTNMTRSNGTADGGANMTQPLVPPKQRS